MATASRVATSCSLTRIGFLNWRTFIWCQQSHGVVDSMKHYWFSELASNANPGPKSSQRKFSSTLNGVQLQFSSVLPMMSILACRNDKLYAVCGKIRSDGLEWDVHMLKRTSFSWAEPFFFKYFWLRSVFGHHYGSWNSRALSHFLITVEVPFEERKIFLIQDLCKTCLRTSLAIVWVDTGIRTASLWCYWHP